MEQVVVNGFKIDWSRAQASSKGAVNSLDAKQLAILKVLYQAQGQIVSQQTLLDKVWQDTIVSPNTVQQSIAQLRKTLGDDGKSQNAIKTHPKLGYSLQFSLEHQLKSSNKPSKKAVYSLLSIAIFAVFIGMLSWQSINQSDQFHVSELRPITVNGEVVKAVTFSPSQNSLYFVADNGHQHTLYKQHLNQPQAIAVEGGLTVYGSIDISPDNTNLAYGELAVKDGKKCISLVSITLLTKVKEVIAQCSSTFNHSPKWLTRSKLLYLAKDTERNNKLMLLDTKTNTASPLLSHVKHVKSYDIYNNKLVILLEQEVQVRQLSKMFELSQPIYSSEQGNITRGRGIRWLDSDRYALLATKTYIANTTNDATHQLNMGVANTKQISDLIATGNNNFIAVLNSENWDINEKALADKQVHTLNSNSLLLERNGKYKGASNQVSFISNRSGSPQIWLELDNALQQLTFAPSGVQDYIWSPNGDTLVFISAGKLWQQTEVGNASQIILSMEPSRLYQLSEQGVLLSANFQGENKLILLSLADNQITTLLDKEVNWAQYVSNDWFITNDSSGKLIEHRGIEANYVEAFKNTIVQWRYFWRQNQSGNWGLYFQDKANNVWLYDPVKSEIQVAGYFDDHTLFATDISARHSKLLSDHFTGAQRDLVQLSITVTD